ncbi:MAG: bacillithiol system redox-active protein YtxJ, partial [Sphingobacteriia bacterium]
MHWIPLINSDQLDQINTLSQQKAQIIFKHSTRCSISSMALNRLEREDPPNSADFYLLDLIQYRTLSNEVAERFSVHHESPQVLVIKKGDCVYDESHQGI